MDEDAAWRSGGRVGGGLLGIEGGGYEGVCGGEVLEEVLVGVVVDFDLEVFVMREGGVFVEVKVDYGEDVFRCGCQ